MSKQLSIESGRGGFAEVGTELFNLEETPLTKDDVEFLRTLVLEIPREHIEVGDTGEECELEVGRIMVDVTKATVVNHQYAEKILPIVASTEMAEWVAKKTGHPGKLHVRRCAVNYMPKGAIIGGHDDGETNPDYLYFMVLHLDEDFAGGEFFSTHYQNKEHVEFDNKSMVCLSRCNLKHGVKRVTDGVRTSLIWFYVDESAPEINRRNYDSNPLPENSAAAKGFGGLVEPDYK